MKISNLAKVLYDSDINSIVDKYSTILNFQRFSDISLSLMLEFQECKLYELYNRLKDILSMEDMKNDLKSSDTDSIVHSHITFTKCTGDLEIEVPDIPE